MKRLFLAAILVLGPVTVQAADTPSAAPQLEWRDFVKSLEPVGEQVIPTLTDPKDPQLRQEMYRMLVSEMAMAYFGLFLGDPQHPDFWPVLNQAFNIWGPNPDNYYYHAPIEGSGVYKISGFRGTVRIVDFQVGPGQIYNTGAGPLVAASANYDVDKLHIGKDGYFEVILSKERPAGYTGDWWKIFPDTTNVHVRQIAYDWLHEEDARFVIERLDKPAAKPRMTADQIAKNLSMIANWAINNSIRSRQLSDAEVKRGLINTVTMNNYASTGGARSQDYFAGQFDLAPDEALIIETDVPKCHYWSVSLTDLNFSVLDYTSRQSSLNGFQARLDKDGKFRTVISATDPGVPNWLDTVGYRKGEIQARWRDCDGSPHPVTTKIKVAEVRKFIPKDTPVVTAEMREADLRVRSKGARLRRRW